MIDNCLSPVNQYESTIKRYIFVVQHDVSDYILICNGMINSISIWVWLQRISFLKQVTHLSVMASQMVSTLNARCIKATNYWTVMTGGIPSQRAGNTKGVYMSWRRHEMHLETSSATWWRFCSGLNVLTNLSEMASLGTLDNTSPRVLGLIR